MKLASGLVIAGKYRLEKRLASGGMGSIWLGRHAQLDVPVAIKFMDATHADSPVARQRFEREAKAAASLQGPHIVHVHDYGVSDGAPYIVMELLQGEDFGRRLHRERRLALAQVSKILTQAAKGLRRAHEAGIVHRDLKPANIFLVRADGDEEVVVKILDFGIAKETLSSIIGEGTKTGELMGSPHYMSPEQIRGVADLDHRSDLWSLGVVVFRAITGHMPFSGDVLGSVIAQILADPIPAATKVAPDLPPAVDAFFNLAFARDRNLRFQSAREMAQTFAAVAQGADALSLPASSGGPRAPFSSEPWMTPPHPGTPLSTRLDGELQPTGARVLTPSPGRLTPFRAPSMPDTMPPVSESQGGVPSTTMTSTGGPLTATGGKSGEMPTQPRWSAAWFGAASALMVVGGGLAYFSLRSGLSSATASPQDRSAAVETAAPAPSAAQAASVGASPSANAVAAAASASASAATKASASPSVAPKAAPVIKGPAAPVTTGKKKPPSWGF